MTSRTITLTAFAAGLITAEVIHFVAGILYRLDRIEAFLNAVVHT